MSDLQITVTGSLPRPEIELTPAAFEARRVALAKASEVTTISSVSDLDAAAAALTTLKSLTRAVEDSRKDVKAPVLEVGRRIDAVAKDYLAEPEAEAKRLSTLVGAYQEAARRKAQREREEAEAAQRAAIEEMQRKHAEAAAIGDAEAADAARAEAADIIAESQLAVTAAEGPKADGIVTSTKWKHEVTDIDALYQARPELCKIEPNNAAIRAILKGNNGKPIPGLRIWQEAGAIVRGAAAPKIEDFDY
jgi:hypothetical protein